MISKEIIDELLSEDVRKQLAIGLNTLVLQPTRLSIQLLTVAEEFLEEEREKLLEEIKES